MKITLRTLIGALPNTKYAEGFSSGVEGVLEICKGYKFKCIEDLSSYAYDELIIHQSAEELSTSYDFFDEFDKGYYRGKLVALKKIFEFSPVW